MKTELKKYKVSEIVEGKRDKSVIQSLLAGYPLVRC
jgi:5S rRNA maturation endonuclease (ribonuclease M5)